MARGRAHRLADSGDAVAPELGAECDQAQAAAPIVAWREDRCADRGIGRIVFADADRIAAPPHPIELCRQCGRVGDRRRRRRPRFPALEIGRGCFAVAPGERDARQRLDMAQLDLARIASAAGAGAEPDQLGPEPVGLGVGVVFQERRRLEGAQDVAAGALVQAERRGDARDGARRGREVLLQIAQRRDGALELREAKGRPVKEPA